MSQLALPLQLADHAVFASFLPDGNETLVATLSDIASGHSTSGCWLWGAQATGKTHLLQAVCDMAGDRSAYLPMSMLFDAGPGVVDGLASREIVCIDDIDATFSNDEWEQALFALFNQVADAGGTLVVSASTAPREANVQLPDLASRMQRLAVFHVRELGDAETIAALQLRSRHRGLELPDETAHWLMRRSRRDMASLYDVLDRLDAAALQAKRRLTVPFVREVLGS